MRSIDSEAAKKIYDVCYILWEFAVNNEVQVSVEADPGLFRGMVFVMEMPLLNLEVNRVIDMTVFGGFNKDILENLLNEMLDEIKTMKINNWKVAGNND